MTKNKKFALSPLTGVVVAAAFMPQISTACGIEPYMGEICIFGTRYCPEGYLPADGRSLPTSAYQALYSLFGTTYGGNQSAFNLPDLRGRTPAGVGQGPGLSPVVAGQQRGQEKVTLDITTLPPHTHGATFTPGGSGPFTVSIPVSSNTAGNKLAPDSSYNYLAASPTGPNGAAIWSNTMTNQVTVNGVTTSGSGGAVTIASTGLGQPATTLSPQLGLTYCVAIQGTYPVNPN